MITSVLKRDIIVVGGSAGSNPVLKRLLGDLPADLPASVFISTHIPPHGKSFLVDILDASGPLPVTRAHDGQAIEQGHVYVAAPDRHLLLIDGVIRLGEGPRENMARPSIDPLFRSAALAFGPRVVGVVLSGMLNDGSSGLDAIKSCGGTTVVQNPLDAEADQMPLSALEAVDIDHVVEAAELGRLIAAIAKTDAGEARAPSDDLRLEVEIAAGVRLGSEALRRIATPSAISCPDCEGVLSEMHASRPLRYRCQVGHAHTAQTLDAKIDEVDEAIRVAMRVIEERVTLVDRMALDARQTGRSAVAELYEERSMEYGRYATTLRGAAIRSLRASQPPSASGIA